MPPRWLFKISFESWTVKAPVFPKGPMTPSMIDDLKFFFIAT
jgi:hypothetical protein